MQNPEPLTLEKFHQFIGEQLQSDATAHSLEQALDDVELPN